MKQIVTVEDLVEFLENNFRPDDPLCYWHEGGAWCECEYVNKVDLGKWFLRYVSDARKQELEYPCCRPEDEELMKKIIEENYRMVKDDDVIVY